MAYERFTLSLAGLDEVVLVETAELARLHRPVLTRLRMLCHRSDRLIVVVAGVPGGGKTLLAALWSRLAQQEGLAPPLYVLPLDGFHLPNAVLEERGIRQYKGAPQSFNVENIAAAVDRLARGERLWWPRYDRTIHEPVARGVLIAAAGAICLLEGNYLLLDQPPWRNIAARAAVRFFIDAEPAAVKDDLLRRHGIGGKSPEEAAAHFERTDLPNIRLVRDRRLPAEIVLKRRRPRDREGSPFPAIGFTVAEAAPPWNAFLFSEDDSVVE